MKIKSHCGKVILFGEYTVIHHKEALAYPLHTIYGYLSDDKTDDSTSNQYLIDFHRYLSSITLPHDVIIDLERLHQDINSGLFLKTNAKIGYGIGSSGILTACILDQYAIFQHKLSLVELKEVLGNLESHFHGNSSGVDPLISFLGRPIYLNEGSMEMLDGIDDSILSRFYLLDTEIPRQTEPLVRWYKEQLSDPDFENITQRLSGLVTELIQCTLRGDHNKLSQLFKQLSKLQLKHFDVLIPESIKDVWKQGLDSDEYYMKLCGAGGGGYMLVLRNDRLPRVSNDLIPIS